MTSKICKEIKNISLVRNVINYAAIVCFFLQIVLDFSEVNFISSLLALAAFLFISYAVFNIRNRSITNALPASVFFFIVAANSFAPLIGTLLEGHAVCSNLEYPIETFFHRFIFSLILITCLFLTNSKSNSSFLFLNKFADKIKINQLYSANLTWGLGLLALFIFFFKSLGLPVIVVKFLDVFGAFLYAPFILLLPLYSKNSKSNSTNKKLLIYYLVMVFLALISNSRMGLVGPILFVAMSYVMVFLTGRVEINKKLFSKIFIAGIIGIVALGVITDISTAILIERAHRNDRNKSDQVSATFDTYRNKAKLRAARIILLRKNDALSIHDWKEDYINNGFIARFVQIKFDDNCLSRIYSFTPTDKKRLADVTLDKILVTFPTPIIKLLGLNIDKLYVASFSMGDMIDVLAGHGYLGGFKTGSIIANSYCIFGWWYPFILLLLYFLIIRIFQFLIYRTSDLAGHNDISTLSLIVPFFLFTNISLDSISSVIAVLLRGIVQLIFVYFIALFILTRVLKVPNKCV